MARRKLIYEIVDDARSETLGRLQAVGSDIEAALVVDLAVRAGYYWRCPRPACRGFTNHSGDKKCANCGKPYKPTR